MKRFVFLILLSVSLPLLLKAQERYNVKGLSALNIQFPHGIGVHLVEGVQAELKFEDKKVTTALSLRYLLAKKQAHPMLQLLPSVRYYFHHTPEEAYLGGFFMIGIMKGGLYSGMGITGGYQTRVFGSFILDLNIKTGMGIYSGIYDKLKLTVLIEPQIGFGYVF